MRIQNSPVPFLIFLIIIIALIHSSINCLSAISSVEEPEKKVRAKRYSSWFSQQFSSNPGAQDQEASKGKNDDPIHTVSYQLVPGGPNPLHNWLVLKQKTKEEERKRNRKFQIYVCKECKVFLLLCVFSGIIIPQLLGDLVVEVLSMGGVGKRHRLVWLESVSICVYFFFF